MKALNNLLYIEWQDLIDSGIPKGTLDSARHRNSKACPFEEDNADRRKCIVQYEKLSDSYKEKIKARFGNPYNYVAQEPIKKMVKKDLKAEEFYLSYRYDTNKILSLEHVNKYTTAVSWLNMLVEVKADKKALKKLLNLTIDQFFLHVMELIKIEKIYLPTSYRKLLANVKEYETKGYESMIDWRFGNKLAAKVKDELSESVLLEMIAHHNQYDDVFIMMQYNKWAAEFGYKDICSRTVTLHRNKNEHLIIQEREGNAALNGKFLKQAKGFRPTFPLAFVENDDNHLDLLYIDLDDTTSSKPYHKHKAIIVIDSFNDYVLGYAYAENLSPELVQAAYVNAMYHIRSLTGAWHLPHETKSDRWALKTLRPFYEAIGKYMDTPVGSKHRGYIEQFFGSSHWKRCIKIGANNYSGNNMTALTRGVNQEVLNANTKNRPTIGKEANEQIEQFIHRLRHMPTTGGTSKHNQWLEAWNNTPQESKRLITDEQFLLKFGITNTYRDRTIQITNRGVEPIINGQKYSYDLDTYDLEHIGKSVTILFDPYDMSRVLVTDFDKVRIIGREARLNSRALADADLDSRTYLNSVLKEKVNAVKEITKKSDRRKEVLKEITLDAEAVLQSGITVKEVQQYAEQKILSSGDERLKDDNIFNQL